MIKQKEPPMMFFRAINLETNSILVFFLSSIFFGDQRKKSSKVDSSSGYRQQEPYTLLETNISHL